MNSKYYLPVAVLLIIMFSSCEKEERDDELPVIIMSGHDYFPLNCDTIYTGEIFVFRAAFADNTELGSYSIDIHHNFDHHSHSTDIVQCPAEPDKVATNPFVFIGQFDIPDGLKEYTSVQEIMVPAGFETGDYHLTVRLTDKTGWQTFRGISIKIDERP